MKLVDLSNPPFTVAENALWSKKYKENYLIWGSIVDSLRDSVNLEVDVKVLNQISSGVHHRGVIWL